MEDHLQELEDGVRFVAVVVCPVPAPPHSEYPGDHLLVNCFYAPAIATSEPTELLLNARADLLVIVRLLIEKHLLAKTRSLCISFLCDRTNAVRERLYRYSLLSDSYPTNSGLLTIDNLLGSNKSIESSEIDAVTELLKSTRRGEGNC